MSTLDASGAKNASDVNNDRNMPVPGNYMVVVQEVKYTEKDGIGQEIVQCSVIGGTTPGQSGCDVALFLKHDENDNYTKKHVRFALASQLMQPGQKVDVDFSFFEAAAGRYLVVNIEEFTGKDGKTNVSVGGFGFDMWAPSDPAVAEIVPRMDGKVPALLQRNSGQQAAAGQQAPAQTQQAPANAVQQPAQQPATAGAAAGNDWGDV